MGNKAKRKQSKQETGQRQEKASVRKKLQAALVRSARRYRLLVDNMSDGVFIVDTDGRFVFVNKVVEQRSGIPSDKFMGLHFLDIVAPKDHERVRMNFEKTMRGEKGSPYEVEYSASDGSPRCVEVNTQPILEGGKVIGLQGISRDITERKRAEEAIVRAHVELEHRVEERTAELRNLNEQLELELSHRRRIEGALVRSKERFRELAELLPEIVFETNTKGDLTYTNRAGFEKFGYSQEEFDQSFSSFLTVAPEDRKRLEKNVARLIKGKNVGVGEYVAQRKDGTTFPVIIHSNVILDGNERPVGLRGVMVDISERKRAEEELLISQDQLRSLASELSLAEERIRRHTAVELHDRISQTMAFAKMKLGVLRKAASGSSLSNSLEEVLALLDETIEDTRSLISELSSPILYELGLVPAIDWLVHEMKQRHGMRVSFDDDGHPKPLDDDVRELLVNVSKHAEAQSVKLSTLRDGNEIRIKVEDDGIGFDATGTSYGVNRHNGFGLFSIRERLEPIRGSVKIESESGNGTCATLVAPLKWTG